MKRNQINKAACLLLAIGLSAGLVAWQNQPGANNQSELRTDTIPSKKVKDIDDALEELEKGRLELEKTLRDRSWEKEIQDAMKNIDGAKIQADIEKALKEVDAAKIQADIQMSLSKLDLEKIQKEISASLKDIDSEKIRKEIEQAMKEVDAAKIKADVEASLSKVDLEKIKLEMEKIKEVDLKKMEEELKKMGPEIEKSMESARKSLEAAKKELTDYKNFINALDKEGLIRKDQPYTIQYKNGVLTINEKQQSDAVKNKFSDFLKNHKDFTIKKDAEDFSIEK